MINLKKIEGVIAKPEVEDSKIIHTNNLGK